MRIMMRTLVEQTLADHPPDILIEPASRVYGALDFQKTAEILDAAAPARDEMTAALRDAVARIAAA